MSTHSSENWPKRLIRTFAIAGFSVLVITGFPGARARRGIDEDAAVGELERHP